MSKYIGKRIVPKHCGEWKKEVAYEMLSIVLDKDRGNSYISRCEVPAGVELSDAKYWALCSDFSQQIQDMSDQLSETESRMTEDLSETKAAMSEELEQESERLNHTVDAAKQTLEEQVSMAREELAQGRLDMENTAQRLEARLDANVAASTVPDSDYAAELVDMRVTLTGETFPSAGAAMRGEVERLECEISEAVEKSVSEARLGCLGINGNLALAFLPAKDPKPNGATLEIGKYLAYRIISTTTWGQLYHSFVNAKMGAMRKYLFLSKIRVISGSTKGISCYQYSPEGENLNSHVKKVANISSGDYQIVVGYGEILENAAQIDVSPCVADLDSVIECDSYCVLVDATAYTDTELEELFRYMTEEEDNYLIRNYENWGVSGMPLYVQASKNAERAQVAESLSGNMAYHVPSYSMLEKNGGAFIQSADDAAWAEIRATRSAEWGTHAGIRLRNLTAGTYLACARFTQIEADEGGVGIPGIGAIEPGIANWASFTSFGTCQLNQPPNQMKILYEYGGGKEYLNFNVQLQGNQFASFQAVIWVYDVSGLTEEEREWMLTQEVPENATAVRLSLKAYQADMAKNAETSALADYAEEAGTAESAHFAEKAGTTEKTEYATISGKWNGKKALVIGDSITAAGKWQQKLSELLGMKVVTHAKGGIGIVKMVDGDNGLTGVYDEETDAAGILRPLTQEDVMDVDLIIGLPAYNERATQYGTAEDLCPQQHTTNGEIQYFINRIYEELNKSGNLTCRVLIATPHCAGKYGYVDADGYEEYPAGTGMTMERLSDLISEIASRNNIPVCDLWHRSGINRSTWCVFGAKPDAVDDRYTKYELDSNGEVVGTSPLRYVNGNSYYQLREGEVVLETYTGSSPYPFNADQLHCSTDGYARIGECIVGAVICAYGV